MDFAVPPDTVFAAPDGWEPFELLPQRSFVSGNTDDRLRVAYHHRGTTLRATVWFGPGTEGPPGHAHGGAIAAVLDEVLGVAAWAAGHPVLAVRLVTGFRQQLPLGTVCAVETKIEAVEGRKVRVSGRLVGAGETVYAEAESLLVNVAADAERDDAGRAPGDEA